MKLRKLLFAKIKARYDEQVSPYYAASRLWTDAIIDPLDTVLGFLWYQAANHAPIEKTIWSDSGLIHYYSFRSSTLFSVQPSRYIPPAGMLLSAK
jgi:hypothetical protein